MFEPRSCQVFSGRGLIEVACGGQHSMFLLYDGSVYTCGSNSCGQLGHDKTGTSPGKLSTVNVRLTLLWLISPNCRLLHQPETLLCVCAKSQSMFENEGEHEVFTKAVSVLFEPLT